MNYGDLAANLINKVAAATNASSIERQALEREFGEDPSEFVIKYAEHLSEADIAPFRDRSP